MTHNVPLPRDPDPAAGEPGDELRALGRASDRARRAVEQATASRDAGPVSAIEAVFLLDDALAQFGALRDAVPGLLAAAEPGPTVAADIKTRADELAAVADQVAAARRELDVLKASERETNARLAELSAFREEIDELRRRERLVTALHELSEQRQVIDQRLTLVRRLTENQENAIAASAGQLTTLSGERRALLAANVRDTLAQATTAQQLLHDEEERARAGQEELAVTKQRLAEAQQRRAELAAERDGRLAKLAAHARADTALAAALAAFRTDGPAGAEQAAGDPVGQLRDALDGVASQLDELDATLRDTVTADQGGYDQDHKRLSWADR
jgi:septal ring factor EnvC (AmiA/AmiB activator)